MDDLPQRNQLECPEEDPEEKTSKARKQLIVSCWIFGALIIFSQNALLTAVAVVVSSLTILFISLFLKRWFSSWEKVLAFSQWLFFGLFIGALVALTFLYS
ncbi:hypothetical protein AGMMS50256_12360 [Betaproteobacteria bacterium]|nr:hypothetical protein AGMMS50256_12360 [Betaproteobacteria bacterium]